MVLCSGFLAENSTAYTQRGEPYLYQPCTDAVRMNLSYWFNESPLSNVKTLDRIG